MSKRYYGQGVSRGRGSGRDSKRVASSMNGLGGLGSLIMLVILFPIGIVYLLCKLFSSNR